MAEYEVTPDLQSQASVEVRDPQADAVAQEATKINALVDVNAGVDPSVRMSKAGYEPMTDFLDSIRTHRTEQMLGHREVLTSNGLETTLSDAEIQSYRDDLSGTNGLLGPYRQKALELMQGVDQNGKADELAFSMMYRMELSRAFGDNTLLDVAGDVPGILVPLRESYNIDDLYQGLGFGDGALSSARNLVDPEHAMETMRSMALSLSPEDRAHMFQDTMKILEDLDNDLIKQQLVTGIFSGNYDPKLMNFWNALDVVDVSTGIGAVGKVAHSMYRSGKMMSLFKKYPTPESFDAVVSASDNSDLSKVTGITKADVADAHDPTIHGDYGVDLTGAPDDVASDIVNMLETQEARILALQEHSLREGVLSSQRQNEIMRLAEEELAKKGYVSDLQTVQTDTGFTITYKEKRYKPDTDTLSFKDRTVTQDFLINDQGNIALDLDKDYIASWNRLDPNARYQGRLRDELVSQAEGITREQGKTINALEMMLTDAYKGLSKKETQALDRILTQGSKESKEYSFQEVFDSARNMGFKDSRANEIAKSYLGQRNLNNTLWDLENKKLVDDMISEGVRLVDIDGQDIPSRHFDTVDEARHAYRTLDSDSLSVSVLDDGLNEASKGGRLDYSTPADFRETLEEAYRRGFKLVKNYHSQGYYRVGDDVTEWALVKPNRILHPRGRAVINKIPGYIPRSRTNSFYFIKDTRDTLVTNPRKAEGGRKSEITLAWSDNKQDALKYARSVGLPDSAVVFDREMSPDRLKDRMILVRGGLFGGKRKATELPFVGKDETLDYEGPMEMMQRYINHLGRQVPAHLWRLGTEKRVVERAKEVFRDSRIHNMNDILPEAERMGFKGTKKYKAFKDMVEQIRNISAIPTDEEMEMARKFEAIGNSLEAHKGLKPFAKYFYTASQRKLNIADQIRGVTFTHMLGMFNPAQFLVQFSGSMVAFAVNPVSAMKAAPKFIGWQMLDGLMDNPVSQRKAADWLRSQGLGDFADSYAVWAKSGFREAVTDSNSDIATLFGRKPYNANVLQRVAANNAVFYEMGELAMSRASVATAVEWYKATNKLKKIDINDDVALKAIYKRAEQYRLNMGRANRSDMNKGLKAVPLQFQQVISKYYEKVLPQWFGGTDEFTTAEKLRLFAIPTAIFGAAAVPGSTFIAEQLATLTGADLTTLTPEEVDMFKAGAAGWVLGEALNMNVDFSSRMALGSDIYERMWDFAQGGGGNLLSTLLGPSGHVATRYTQGSQYIWKAVDLTTKMDTFTPDEVIMLTKVVSDAMLNLPSGTRNMKHYMPHVLQNKDAFMKDGRYLWDWEDMNTQTAVMAALGFQPNEMLDLYELDNQLRGGEKAQGLQFLKTDKHVVAHILGVAIPNAETEDQRMQLSRFAEAIIKSYDLIDAKKLLSDVFKEMNTPQKSQYDLLRKLQLHNATRQEDGLNFINRLVSEQNERFNGGQ